MWCSTDLIDLHVSGTFNLSHDSGDSIRLPLHHLEIFSKELDRQLRPNPLEQFLYGHLAGLREVDKDSRDLAELCTDDLYKLFL